jgi:F0F1-type ATP synthase assembly protein I
MKSLEKNKTSSGDLKDMIAAFEEATSITITLVAFPVILLVLGVFIDKTFSTTPLFIFVGIISGVVLGIYRAVDVSKKYKTTMKKVNKSERKTPLR